MTDPIHDSNLDPDKFVTVGKFLEPINAQMAKGLLESAGMECFLQGENANSLLALAFRARLLVHKQDEETARQILGEAVGELTGDELTPQEQHELEGAMINPEPNNEPNRPRAVLCLSGGMDSSVCATLAAQDYDLFALHFSYGQRTEARELRSAQEVARIVGIKEFLHLKIDLFRRIGGSALTDASIAVPPAGDEAAIGNEVPVTYVPFRNAHFLSAAVSWAEVLGAKKVFIGAVEQDSSGYPDCRPAYYEAFNQLIKMGTKEGQIQIATPLIEMRKSEIVRLGVELGAPFHVSWSCYSSETEACGVCESCVLRLRAFREAGAVDPIPYAVA